MATLGARDGPLLRELQKRERPARYHYCANEPHGVCNWLVRDGAPHGLLHRVRAQPHHPQSRRSRQLAGLGRLRARQEAARLFATAFRAAARGSAVGKGPLTFDFVNDALTGHLDGVITIAVGEADAVERERQRQAMAETYRSLLGHLRHESGHYYWMLLVEGTDNIEPFRAAVRRRARELQRRARAPPRRGAPARLVAAPRVGLCKLASVGGLGGDLGALSAHGRCARYGGRPQDRAAARRASRARPRWRCRAHGRLSRGTLRGAGRALGPPHARAQRHQPQHGARRLLSVRDPRGRGCQARVRAPHHPPGGAADGVYDPVRR